MIRLKIDVTKIDKSLLFKGEKGTYCDVTLMDNKDGPDQYGQDGFAVQDVGKARREAGEKGPIIGNWSHVGQPFQKQSQRPSSAQRPASQQPRQNAGSMQPSDDFDDVPF